MTSKAISVLMVFVFCSMAIGGTHHRVTAQASQPRQVQIVPDWGEWVIVPSPTQDELTGISMLSSVDGWAVGNNGVILHWDGNVWSEIASPTVENLFAVDMVSPTDGWAVGEGTILHWDGSSWVQVQSPVGFFLEDVEMLTSTDGWIVGMGGTTLHWDGNEWTQANSDYVPHLENVDMLSSNEGWAVGEDVNIEILRWDGSKWSQFPAPRIDSRLLSVTMVSTSEGWAGGRDGVMVRWNGSTWSKVNIPTDAWIEAIDMLSSTDGWAVGQYGDILHWDGVSWKRYSTPLSSGWLRDVEMISVDEGWAVGLDGVILRYGDFSSVAINYSSGAPGSYFTVTGEHFPPNSSASVSINGHFLGTVQTDSSGNLIFLLNTDQANAGYYSVVVHENPEAEVSFLLDSDDPLRPKENDGVIFNVPGGIAYSHQIYLPLNQK